MFTTFAVFIRSAEEIGASFRRLDTCLERADVDRSDVLTLPWLDNGVRLKLGLTTDVLPMNKIN